MSVLCQNFVQNAWKQELCSNCYRAKHEHGLNHMTSFSSSNVISGRCLVLKSTFHDPSVTTSSTTTTTTTTWRGLAMQNGKSLKVNGTCPPPLAGILKGGLRRRPLFHERQLGSVGFREEAPQIIGYGGEIENSSNDYGEDAKETNGVSINGKWGNGTIGEEAEDDNGSGDDDDEICNGDNDSLENFDLTEEDREFARLTEKNTEYNSIPKNLVQGAEEETADQTKVKFSGVVVARESQDSARNPILEPIGEVEVAPVAGILISVPHEIDNPRESSDSVTVEKETNSILLISKEVVVVEKHKSEISVINHRDEAFSATDSERSSSGSDSPTADPTLVPPPDYMVNEASDDLTFDEPVSQVSNSSSDEKNGSTTTNGHSPIDLHYSSSPIVNGVTSVTETSRNSYPVPYCTSPVKPQSPPNQHLNLSPKQTSGKTKPKVPIKPNKLINPPEEMSPNDESSPKSVQEKKSLEPHNSSPTTISSKESFLYPQQKNSSSIGVESNGHPSESEDGTENESGEEKKDLSFQAKMAAISNNLDLSRRKRQAPMPPHSPEITRPPRSTRGKLVLPISAVHRPLQPWESDPGPRSTTPTPVSTPTSASSLTPVSTPSPAQPQRPAPLSPNNENPPRRSACSLKTKSPSLESGIAFSRFPCIPSHDYVKDVKKLKSKFSLKKLLKFGKDGDEIRGKGSSSGGQPTLMERRTKIEILHPIDLANLAATSPTDDVNRGSPTDNVFYETPVINDQQRNSSFVNNHHNNHGVSNACLSRLTPPPCLSSLSDDETLSSPPFPPPRTKSADNLRPMRPPPPTVQLSSPSMLTETNPGSETRHAPITPGGEYANLGDARTVLAPKKPERGSPASCRRETNQTADRGSPINMTNHLYEFIPVNTTSPSSSATVGQNGSDRMYYEPPAVELSSTTAHSFNVNVTVNGDDSETTQKWRRLVRPAGVTWVATDDDSGDAGSEGSGGDSAMMPSVPARSVAPVPITALYAEIRKPKSSKQTLPPRSFTPTDPASSSLSEDEPPNTPPSLEGSHRLLFHGGRRALLARGLQENYSAVTAANHEALSQMVEELLQSKPNSNSIRGSLKDETLRWSDFTLETKTPNVTLEHASFYNAMSKDEVPVTLMATDELLPGPICTRNPFILCPITTFQDWVPSTSGLQRGRVAVLERLHIQTLPDFIRELRAQIDTDVDLFERGASVVVLQLLSALKHLQAEGVEEVPESDVWVLVHRGDPFRFAWRLTMLPVEPPSAGGRTSLCECGVRVLKMLLQGTSDMSSGIEVPETLPSRKTFQGVIEQLRTERATSLSKAKAVLEFLLWGPIELHVTGVETQETNLQHWLDLERALTLTNLIRWQRNGTLDLTPLDQLRLLFVVRTSARTLREVASLVASTASNA